MADSEPPAELLATGEDVPSLLDAMEDAELVEHPSVTPEDAAPSSNGSTASVTSPTTPTTMPPKPRKLSGGHSSMRRVRSNSGNSTTSTSSLSSTTVRHTSVATSSTSTGIVIGGIRRRHRRTPSGGNAAMINRQGSTGSSDDEAESSTVEVKKTPLSLTKSKRATLPSRSFKNVATIIRSNVRQSVHTSKPSANGGETTDDENSNSKSFAGVAQQVVSTQRAVKGFKNILDMWNRSSTGAVHVYKGIHMEKKKLDLKAVVAEFKEIKRRQFYQELVVYLVFLLLLFSLLRWLPVQESYQQNDVVGYLTCREEGVCELTKYSDVYEFANTMSERICGRKDVTAQWMRIGGVRFRQVRVKEEQCRVYNGWFAPCYPFYSPEAEHKEPIVGPTSKRVYSWNDELGPLAPQLSSSIFEWMFSSFSKDESFGNGGYVVDLCDASVDDLQEDEWLSVSTRAFSVEFTLINPVTRVFTIGWHVFTVNPSGHMKHFPHSANLRVVGLEENELVGTREAVNSSKSSSSFQRARKLISRVVNIVDRRILLWCALVLFFVTYCIGEATEMTTMGFNTYLKSDMWNVFELTHLFVLASVLTYSALYYRASRGFTAHLGDIMSGKGVDEIDHSDVQELLRTFQQLSDLASLASAISLLKVFKFLRMNSTLNLLWRVLGMAMRDLMGFLVIFNLIFLGYSAMGSYAFGFALEEFSTIANSYATCFRMLAGEMDYPRLRQANPRIAPVFIVTFIVLVFQILVNMFVAILSEYYESAKNDEGSGEDVEYDVLARVRNYLKACSPTVVVKKNEVIRLIPKQTVRLISTNLVDQEETRQRAKKLFRGAVWRVVALLRFGMKFDRRIMPTRQTMIPTSREKDGMASHIRLSENFDHKTIKEMIPIGITIRLQGDSLLGDGLALKVIRHNKLSVECDVLGHVDSAGNISTGLEPSSSSFSDSESESSGLHFMPRERVLELLGGEKLRIPWQIFAFHLSKTFLKELQVSLLRATKIWSYSKTHLVGDYYLLLLFESMREEGRTSLRYDEVYRMLDLYLRKDKKKSQCTQAEVRQETLQVMYRFRKSLIDMPSREKEGHNYRPKPVDTSSIDLGQLEHLADMLAQNCHDMWALERLKQGWNYGPQRNDSKKLHPNLVPYHLLSWDEQQYDYRSSVETLKTILFMNHSIVRSTPGSGSFQESFSRSSSNISDSDVAEAEAMAPLEPVGETDVKSSGPEAKAFLKKPVPSLLREAMSFRRNSLMEDSPYSTMYGEKLDLVYRPLPIDTSKVELPVRLMRLVDLLAENAHEVWAKGRMDESWTYGPQRNDQSKKHPCLVPYIFLTDEEKEYDINIAKETLKTLLAMKFTLVDRSSRF
ncbi:hypothetical protein Poli38472_006681 [Pythium oligandrum]|uniref:Uncharacterized protein n=1 Tax=Pythium oligandrum TaxID=41045 RepID=A0A8K1FC08_PYTOL|nr:hypothetical protein Poli38472_006681 [Pythium oligandrum]|eukprot:TMW56671.1 hypothetical protein Poli38472_006681 [Pythium oligandrum]